MFMHVWRARYVFALALFACGAVGCGGSAKQVVITSDPEGAKLYRTRVSGNTDFQPVYIGQTPFRPKDKWNFDADGEPVSYVIRAEKEDHQPAEIPIEFNPPQQRQYHLTLRREVVNVPDIRITPTQTVQGVRLGTAVVSTRAYLETIEQSPNVKAVTRVTNYQDQAAQLEPHALSPRGETLCYPLKIVEILNPQEHVARGNDTVTRLAAAHQTLPEYFRIANNLDPNVEQIEPGTRLKVGRFEVYSNLWLQPVGSSGKTRLTIGRTLDLFPAFTPDGSSIVFSSDRTGDNKTLWRVKTQGGGGITRLTSSQAEDFAPSVSPDGKTIAYTSQIPRADEPQIWTIDPTGALATQLREGEQPQVSPDGKRILFVKYDDVAKNHNVWVMSLDGSNETQLTQNPPGVDCAGPRWSPDGRWIVYASNDAFDTQKLRNYDIWMMDASGGQRTQLTTNGSVDDNPAWNATGQSIYFRSNRGGAWNIWRFDPVPAEDAAATAPAAG